MPRYSSLLEVQSDLQAGSLSMEALIDYYLKRIEEQKHLNVYVEVFAQEAKERAIALDKKSQESPDTLGKLFGMVVSIKDVLCYKGHEVTGGSKILQGFESLFSATAITRLLEEDAIIIGRTNCDEFAMGSSNENSFFGPVKNAADIEKVPGGSSGGAAVSVQADTCLAALGTDTGGSVRQPAALCGVWGMKPTYGRISRYGLLAYGSSFDQVGILANSPEDIAILMGIMAGSDDFDSTASTREVPTYFPISPASSKKKIAYYKTALEHEGLDQEVQASCFGLIDQLKEDGHKVEGVDFDYLDYIIPAYYVLTTAEASTNLSRYDGIRYGYRSEAAKNLMETYKKSRTEGFGTEVKRRIMLGTFVLSSGYYDAYYTKAQKIRHLIQEKTMELFKSYDFILIPASPTTAWNIGEKADDPVEMYLADIFTVQANMAGIPAISIPVGIHSNGLPIGLQFMANRFEEQALFSFSKYIEQSILMEV